MLIKSIIGGTLDSYGHQLKSRCPGRRICNLHSVELYFIGLPDTVDHTPDDIVVQRKFCVDHRAVIYGWKFLNDILIRAVFTKGLCFQKCADPLGFQRFDPHLALKILISLRSQFLTEAYDRGFAGKCFPCQISRR